MSGDLVVVSDFATGRLHRVTAPGELAPITPEGAWRYADMVHDVARDRLFAVREEPRARCRRGPRRVGQRPRRRSTWRPARSRSSPPAPTSTPRRGSRRTAGRSSGWSGTTRTCPGTAPSCSWRPWGHGGELGPPTTVAGSSSEWISQPRWSPAGVLHFVAEPDGWMNLFRYRGGAVEPIAPMAVEFAVSGLDLRRHRVRLPARRRDPGRRAGAAAATGSTGSRPTASWTTLDLPYTEILSISIDGDDGGPAGRLRRSSPPSSAELSLGTGRIEVLRQATPSVAGSRGRLRAAATSSSRRPAGGPRTATTTRPHNRALPWRRTASSRRSS